MESIYQIKLGESYQPKIIFISNLVESSFFKISSANPTVDAAMVVTAVLIHLQTARNLDKTLVENIQILNMV